MSLLFVCHMYTFCCCFHEIQLVFFYTCSFLLLCGQFFYTVSFGYIVHNFPPIIITACRHFTLFPIAAVYLFMKSFHEAHFFIHHNVSDDIFYQATLTRPVTVIMFLQWQRSVNGPARIEHQYTTNKKPSG